MRDKIATYEILEVKMLNPIEEAKFAVLKAMCRELKIPGPPEIMIGLRVHDKNGVLVFDDIQRGHSWTRNFYNLLFGFATGSPGAGASFGAGYMVVKNKNAGLWGVNPQSSNYATHFWTGGLANVNRGICVGTSATAFSVEQNALIALIATGNGAGQFAYQLEIAAAPGYTAGTKTWKHTRYRIFNNNSGGSITVAETGLAMENSWVTTSAWLTERSVLSPTVAVANGAQLTVTYEISMDFSAID